MRTHPGSLRLWRALSSVVLALSLLLSVFIGVAFGADGPSDGLGPAPGVDRGSPRRSFDGFLAAGSRGDFASAAHYLDLRPLPRARQATEGRVIAEKLYYLLTHVAQFDVQKIPDDPDTVIPKGESALDVGTFDVRDGPVPILMTRAKFPDGAERWLFAKSTVSISPTMYATLGRPSIGDRVPAPLRAIVFGNQLWQWLALLLAIPVAWLVSRVLSFVLVRLLAFLARRTATTIDDALVAGLEPPLRIILVALALEAAAQPLQLTRSLVDVLEHFTFTLMVIGGAWAAMRAVSTVAAGLVSTVPENAEAEMARRRLRTRLAIFQKLASAFVLLVAVALTLLQFERVRAVGVSLLASAGLAGVVLGFAAQRSLGAVISGIQLSVTQPIRIGDHVVVEGEFGTIETIHLTQVVVALWDERRMVVPVSQFLEKPFLNWSKAGDKLVGVVTFACDYTTPVDPIRQLLRTICEASPHWDKRDCVLQVTEVGDRSMTLRALVSARAPGALWDLRCEVREKMMNALLLVDHGRALPRTRWDQFGAPVDKSAA